MGLLRCLLLGMLWMVRCPAWAADTVSEWTSAPCSSVALGPGTELSHLRRTFLLGHPDYTIQYHFYADEQCRLPLYSFVFKGAADTTARSASVPDALEVTVRLARVLFTLDSPRGAPAAQACADGKFEIGVQRDVTASGCLHIAPLASCGVDFELVRIKDGVATPGFRTANMCSAQGRPQALQSAGAAFIGEFAAPAEGRR